MKLTTAQLDEIERIAKKATPGKWFTMTPVGDASIYVSGPTGLGDNGFICGEAADERDAEYIATMGPSTTLALVAEVRELRTAIEKVRAIHMKSPRRSECLTCADENEAPASWPCDTIQALGDAS